MKLKIESRETDDLYWIVTSCILWLTESKAKFWARGCHACGGVLVMGKERLATTLAHSPCPEKIGDGWEKRIYLLGEI